MQKKIKTCYKLLCNSQVTLQRKKNINVRNSTKLWISDHLHDIIFSKDEKNFNFPDHHYQTSKDITGSKGAAEKQGKPVLFEE
jgi:hypothetical protein